MSDDIFSDPRFYKVLNAEIGDHGAARATESKVPAAISRYPFFAHFPDAVVVAARDAAHKYGIFASVTLAQWALESAFGRHMPHGSNNPFGIKAAGGQKYVATPTHEFRGGRYVTVPQHFAVYDSLGEAFEAHAALLAHSKYYEKARHAKSPNEFASDLTGVYATDPKYGEKLIAIMRKYDLAQFDV